MKKILTTILGSLSILPFNVYAQVGINTVTPNSKSILDVVSSNKGVLIPRINLTSTTMDLDSDNNTPQPDGLLIYNSGNTLSTGFYFWKDNKWMALEEGVADAPEIEDLLCLEATIEPQTLKSGEPYKGLLKVPYDGGNGGKYSGGTEILSTGNTGLKAVLKPGKLEYGYGFLVYDITGVPDYDSPTGATFALSFGTTDPKLCSTTVGDEIDADIKTKAVMGQFKRTTQSETGRDGYHFTVTTPDGRFSFRAFVHDNATFQDTNLQFKSNIGDVLVGSSEGTFYNSGAYGNSRNTMPVKGGEWGGGGNDSGASGNSWVGQTSSNFPAWGNDDVYNDYYPEHRIYAFTVSDGNDKVFYKFSFMMMSTNPRAKVDATSCPDGTCNTTKAFFLIEQVTAP